MLLFIGWHILIEQFNAVFHDRVAITSILAGFLPSMVHDSLSTRNPALESFTAMLSDLPGAYSFYLSQFLITPPNVSQDGIVGSYLPSLIEVINPAPPKNSLLTSFVIFLFLCGFLGSLMYISKRSRRNNQSKDDLDNNHANNYTNI